MTTYIYNKDSFENSVEVDNYPWGFKKTSKRFWLETNKKGTRLVSSTKNPKTGEWCKAKTSTYSELGVLTSDVKDGKSKCSVYKDRFNKAPWCANLKEMIVQGIAPGDCPYITELEGYKPSIDLNDTEYKDLLPFLKLGLKSGDTSPIDKKDLDKFLDS